MKFGTMTHIGPLQRGEGKNFELLKSQDGGGSRRFDRDDLHEIWHGDAYWPAKANVTLKFVIVENYTWRTAAVLKIENCFKIV